ncbi:MAG: efflux RND transporter periplasmic adaptor subunit [Holosporales bacterium]|jgi:membrane fusion protein (multidrug efflux system)|nr:efflux RND transporter periplasmic adaptor subunit [Holosporales bacterium]
MKIINKTKEFLKSSILFWKKFLTTEDKKEYILTNMAFFNKQVIVLLVAVLSVFIIHNAMKPVLRGACRLVLQSSNIDAVDFERRVVGVEAQKVKLGTISRQVRSIGVLKANAEVVIKSEIAGKLKEILFVEGGEVEKDQVLIKFEDEGYKASKEKYEAAYVLAKTEHDRMKKLYDQKVGALKDYDKAVAQMNEAKAQLAEAEYQLSKTEIKAPFAGTIGIMKVNTGNIVQQHTELVSLVDNSSVKVEFTVPAKYVENIAVGQSVEVTVDSFGDRKFSGTVDAVDSELDTKNHSILVRAVVPNPSGVLKHGLFANVILVTGEKNDVLLVDEDAIYREGSIELVWFIDDKGRVYTRRVLTGAKEISGVEILAGLKEDDTVVTAGHLKLTDGLKVKILNESENKEEKATKKQEKRAKK